MAKTFGEILFFRVSFDPQLGQMMSEALDVSVEVDVVLVEGFRLLSSSSACSTWFSRTCNFIPPIAFE